MKRPSVTRVVALWVLLFYGSAFGAASVLDAIAAARANRSLAHVEADAGVECYAHDEATCQLCRVGSTPGWVAAAHIAGVAITRTAESHGAACELSPAVARTALHSRAPPPIA